MNPYKINSIEQAIIETLNDDKLTYKLEQNAKKKAMQFEINTIFSKIFHTYEKALEKQ